MTAIRREVLDDCLAQVLADLPAMEQRISPAITRLVGDLTALPEWGPGPLRSALATARRQGQHSVLAAAGTLPRDILRAVTSSLGPLPDVDVPGLVPLVPSRQGPYVVMAAVSSRLEPEPRASASRVAQMVPTSPDVVLELVRALCARAEADAPVADRPPEPATVRRVLCIGVLCAVATFRYVTFAAEDRPWAAVVLGLGAGMVVLSEAQLFDASAQRPSPASVPAPVIARPARPEDKYGLVRDRAADFGSLTVVMGMEVDEIVACLGGAPDVRPEGDWFTLLHTLVLRPAPLAIALHEANGRLGENLSDIARLSAHGRVGSVRWDIHGAVLLCFADAGRLLDSFEDWEDAKDPVVQALFTDLETKDWGPKFEQSLLVVERFTGVDLSPDLTERVMAAEEGYDCGWR